MTSITTELVVDAIRRELAAVAAELIIDAVGVEFVLAGVAGIIPALVIEIGAPRNCVRVHGRSSGGIV